MLKSRKFHGANLDEVMDEVRRFGYEDRVCAQCRYGAVDNEGLCVMDDAHQAIRPVA